MERCYAAKNQALLYKKNSYRGKYKQQIEEDFNKISNITFNAFKCLNQAISASSFPWCVPLPGESAGFEAIISHLCAHQKWSIIFPIPHINANKITI